MSLEPFVRVVGVAAPLLRANIDTDQIAPGHTFMKKQVAGYGGGLFFNWRFLPDGSENPEFVLNCLPFREARFLLAGANFGCGSSREFAVWALRDFGILSLFDTSFCEIFTSNCYMNGVLPIVLDEAAVTTLAADVAPGREQIPVDLAEKVVIAPGGAQHGFHVPALQRERLVEGLDAIDATQKREPAIAAFQARDAARRPWVYPTGGGA